MNVKMQNGQVGWLPLDAAVPDGQLAVVTKTTRAFLSLNPETARDRNMILLEAGELVILEGVEGDYIRVVSRDAEKRGWVKGIAEVSIDEVDLLIGLKIFDAMQETSESSLKAKLQQIRSVKGYKNSMMANVVENLLSNDYSMR